MNKPIDDMNKIVSKITSGSFSKEERMLLGAMAINGHSLSVDNIDKYSGRIMTENKQNYTRYILDGMVILHIDKDVEYVDNVIRRTMTPKYYKYGAQYSGGDDE